MPYRILFLLTTTVLSSFYTYGQDLTVAGGRTTGAATKHDYAGLEINLPWKEKIRESNHWRLDLDHAFSLSRLHDVSTVYLASWAPNVFESSLTLGMVYGRLGLRARVYHYSNANLSSTNDGIDVAALGFSYRF